MEIHWTAIFTLLISLQLFDWAEANKNEDANYWKKVNDKELRKSLRLTQNTKKAKNVILFVGDGMSLPTVSAARIFKNQRRAEVDGKNDKVGEEIPLTFETFPHIGLSRTYNDDNQISDSASTASALASGIKTKYGTMGFDNSIVRGDVNLQNKAKRVETILKWAQDAGKDTGLVTNTRVTHATPAAFYAHSADRDWECDKEVPADGRKDVSDIAKQLVYSDPGRRTKLIMGGGEMAWKTGVNKPNLGPDRPLHDFACDRIDKEDLTETFLKKNESVPGFENTKGRYIKNYAELKKAIDEVKNYDYLLGLFSPTLMKLNSENQKNTDDREPDIVEMTELAVKFLSKNESNGFFLMIEGGLVDTSHHYAEANNALEETMMLDNAVERALELVDTDETLIIVTADHGHTMSHSGYTERGGDIRGLTYNQDVDGNVYNILSYANGKGFKKHYSVENGKIHRKVPSEDDTVKANFVNPSTIETEFEYHSGSDVGIFAIGPWSHLFHSVHEQTYINTVMAFGSCLGEYSEEPHCSKSSFFQFSTMVLLLSYFASQLFK